MRNPSQEPRSASQRPVVNAELPARNAAAGRQVIDPATRKALAEFKAVLNRCYGERLRGVYLFGSRARGDHRPDSDADVAVFLDQVVDPLGEQLGLVDRGYPILLDTGINIQPWVFEYASLADPANHRASYLVRAIREEGIGL
jgi:uncharacterized protein